MIEACGLCGCSENQAVFEVNQVPVCATPLSEKGKVAPKGNLNIVKCNQCGHIYNRGFDSQLISLIYENDFAGSIPTSKATIQRLHDILQDAIGFRDRHYPKVVEVGASNFFLSQLMLEQGTKRVLAFEPSNAFSKPETAPIDFINDFFNDELIPETYADYDLLVMRHVLEHIPDLEGMLTMLGRAAAKGSFLYIEVPNASDIFEKSRIFDFFYEHVNYFTPEVLAGALTRHGFQVEKFTTLVGGQHMGLLLKKCEQPKPWSPEKSHLPDVGRLGAEVEGYRQNLERHFSGRNNFAIYGAGAHAVSTLALADGLRKGCRFSLDMNPYKLGKYLPGTDIPIKSPSREILKEVDAVLVLASLHEPEIVRDLKNTWGFQGQVYGTHPNFREV